MLQTVFLGHLDLSHTYIKHCGTLPEVNRQTWWSLSELVNGDHIHLVDIKNKVFMVSLCTQSY